MITHTSLSFEMMSEASTVVPRFAPNLGFTLAAIAFATFATFVAMRAGAAPALRRWQRWLNLLAVSSWASAAWLAGLRLLSSATGFELAAKSVMLLALFVAALPLTRDLLAGLAMAVEGRHRLGDDLRIDGHEGRLVHLGLRSIVLRKSDQTEITIPNRTFVAATVQRLDSSGRDAPCELEIPLPPGLDVEEATRRFTEAALLSPFAAPGRMPEVFAIADPNGALRLRIRGYVFDRAHEQQFLGDILTQAELRESRD